MFLWNSFLRNCLYSLRAVCVFRSFLIVFVWWFCCVLTFAFKFLVFLRLGTKNSLAHTHENYAIVDKKQCTNIVEKERRRRRGRSRRSRRRCKRRQKWGGNKDFRYSVVLYQLLVVVFPFFGVIWHFSALFFNFSLEYAFDSFGGVVVATKLLLLLLLAFVACALC